MPVVSSNGADRRLKPLCKRIEVLGTLLPDQTDPPRRPFSQRPPTASSRIGYAESDRERLEVVLLDVNLGSYGLPIPIHRYIKACEHPSFKFLPGVLCQKYPRASKFRLDLIESLTPSNLPIAIDAQDEYVDHSTVTQHDVRNTA